MTSVKLRLGFDEKIPEILALAAQDAGADYIAFHGRTRAGGYTAAVDYAAIGRAKEAVTIPVIANGDISPENAAQALNLTNADALMIGRACIGKPWVFHEIKTGESIDAATKKAIILAHFDAMIEHYGEHGAAIFRKHLHRYSKGIDGASAFRDEINHIAEPNILRQKIQAFF